MRWLTAKESSFDFLEVAGVIPAALARPGEAVDDPSAPYGIALSPRALQDGITEIRKVHRDRLAIDFMYTYLRTNIFEGKSVYHLFPLTTWTLLGLLPIGLLFGSSVNYAYRRPLLRGIVRRGPRLVDRHEFNVARKADGIGVPY